MHCCGEQAKDSSPDEGSLYARLGQPSVIWLTYKLVTTTDAYRHTTASPATGTAYTPTTRHLARPYAYR
jgi:hypothetical protein